MRLVHSLLALVSLKTAHIYTNAHELAPAATSSTCTLSASGGDDGPSFVNAIKTCDTIVVPQSTTLNIASRMNTTGVSNKHISLAGTVKFAANIPYWTGNAFYFAYQTQVAFWLLGGKNITVDGGGTLDGQGQAWYDAFASNSSLARPILFTLYQATDVAVSNVKMINGPEWVVFVNEGKNIVFDNINIKSASTSSKPAKNTDGWDIYRSDNVTIKNSVVVNGDDCVSFKPNTTNVLVSNLSCTGSHGISVGSLGQYPGEYDIVQNIVAKNITITNSQNGARIKAWAGKNVGSGLVKNITFSYFTEGNVDHPLVIDQCYMTAASDCSAYPSNTYIQDVYFNNLSGTSSGSTVASVACSPGARCKNINVNNFSVLPKTSGAKPTYSCQNVNILGNSASLFPTCTVTG